MQKLIMGAGGGGGDKGRTPVEASDSLRSKQIARIIDILSEGEIVGLKNGLRSVYLNETPVQGPDGSFNFRDVSVEHRVGTVHQEEVSGQNGAEFEIGVGTEVKFDTSITRSISTANVGAVRVTLGIPQLSSQNMENGDLTGASVAFKIQVQSNGAGFVDKVVDTISGKTSSRYQASYVIELSGAGPWDVRVVRTTPDATTSTLNNKLFFDSFTGIIPARLAYPNSALVSVRVDAANFSSIPNRAYHIRGLIVKVPTNYDPATRNYTGVWDGTFKLAWTDNPAWCFYDLALNERYGLGRMIDADSIDKWELYSVARYCDQMVPNGRGGMEPRFTCNLYLQSREDAFKVLQNFASIFRSIIYWANGAIITSQDRPADAVMQFNNTNVEDGVFSYSGSSLKQRHTVALVAWNDPNDFYRQKVEYVQDDEMVQRFGIVESEVTAFGCSSQSQAHRFGRWLLATERYANETVTFKAGLDGLALYPGAVIQTSDQNRAGERMGGRILAIDFSGGTQRLTVDAPIQFEDGHTYRISAVLADGRLVSRALSLIGTGPDGTLLTPTTPFDGEIVAGTPFILTDVAKLVPEQWRVVSLSESSPGVVEINALSYVAGLYDNVEKDFVIEQPPVSTINTRPPTPSMLTVALSHYRVDGQLTGLRALVSWQSNVGQYRLAWRKQNGQWNNRDLSETSYEIDNIDPAVYEFIVVAIGVNGRESNGARLVLNLAEGAAEAVDQLPMPANLRLAYPYVRSDAIFEWDSVPGALGYEVEVSPSATPFTAIRSKDVGNTLGFVYDPMDMKVDGGPFRSLTIRVRGYTIFGKKGRWATLTVGNPQVPVLSGIQIRPGIKSIFFQCAEPDDLDFAGIVLWMGDSPDFVPSDDNIVYSDIGVFAVFSNGPDGQPLVPGREYYLKAAGYDAIGKDDMNISGSFAITVFNNAPDKDSIIADMIKDGALTITKFADNLEPVGIYESLPVLPGDPPYAGPKNINVDGKLYTLIDGAWVPNIATVGPGSVDEDALDPGLSERINLIDGPETTPGTVANKIADKVKEVSDLLTEQIDYVGALTQTAISAAQIAIQAQNTGQAASTLYTNTIAAKVGNDISAAIFEERRVTADALQSIATQVNGLSVTWKQDISSAITNYNQTVASENFASATSVQQLSTKVNGQATAIEQSATIVSGLKARVETKIDANGIITGYALDVDTPRDGLPTSTMTFAVGTFRVQGIGANATPPEVIFEIVTTPEGKRVRIDGITIKDGSLTGDKITANSITAAQIAAGAITSEQIKAGAITTDMIVIGTAGGIPGTFIKEGTIRTAQLAAGSVTGDQILANTIVAGHLTSNAVTTDKLAANAVTANKIDSRGLTIKDNEGNIILGALTALDWGKVNKPTNLANLGANDSIKNADITMSTNGQLNGAGGGKVALTGLGYWGHPYATENTGAFATLSGKITASIAASYFAENSLSGTYISNLAADKILVGNLVGHTIKTSNGFPRIALNDGGNNYFEVFNSQGQMVVSLGGGTGNLSVSSYSTVPGILVTSSSSSTAGIAVQANGSFGISASIQSGGGAGLSASTNSSSSSAPAIRAESQSNSAAIDVTGGSFAPAIKITGGYDGIRQSAGGVNWLFHILPTVDNAYTFGSGSNRWTTAFVASGVVSTSDERMKTEIADCDLGLDFIRSLRPIKYKMMESSKEMVFETPEPTEDEPFPQPQVKEMISIPGARFHYGQSAQVVRAAMLAHGVPDAGFWALEDKNDPESRQAVRYDELMGGPGVRAMQELADQLDAARAEIATLKATQLTILERLAALEGRR